MRENQIDKLDLHGVTHEDAIWIVEEWVLMRSFRNKAFTGKIIPGNSSKMRTLAESALKKHDFEYKHMSDGSILVNGKL